MEKLQNLINHIALVIDASGSMSNLKQDVVKVFDKQLDTLKKVSVDTNQETRISIYLFHDRNIDCLVFDMDVMRMKSLSGHYNVGGGTPLIDATVRALEDHGLHQVKYGDHAYLTYVLTDGDENTSNRTAQSLSYSISQLSKDHTVVCLVPSMSAKWTAEKYGFPKENVSVWDVSKEGLEKAGDDFTESTVRYMSMRATGQKSTTSFFKKMDTSNLTKQNVLSNLNELKPTEYMSIPVRKDQRIDEFVQSWTKKTFINGSAYYEHSKTELIQGNKELAVQNRLTGKVYTGKNIRQFLNLPSNDVKIAPDHNKDYRIFVQSTAPNRKLIGGTMCLVLV